VIRGDAIAARSLLLPEVEDVENVFAIGNARKRRVENPARYLATMVKRTRTAQTSSSLPQAAHWPPAKGLMPHFASVAIHLWRKGGKSGERAFLEKCE
jgi:hypothetical protein